MLTSLKVLREELAERLPLLGLKSSEAEVDCGHHLVVNSHSVIMHTNQIFDQVSSAVDDVWSARNDPKLWKSLDSAFKTFVANKPSPSVSQVLLSIL